MLLLYCSTPCSEEERQLLARHRLIHAHVVVDTVNQRQQLLLFGFSKTESAWLAYVSHWVSLCQKAITERVFVCNSER